MFTTISEGLEGLKVTGKMIHYGETGNGPAEYPEDAALMSFK